MPSAAVMILGIFRRPSMTAASRAQSRTRASLFSRAWPAIFLILSQPRASRSAKKPTPASQPAMSHVQILARTCLWTGIEGHSAGDVGCAVESGACASAGACDVKVDGVTAGCD